LGEYLCAGFFDHSSKSTGLFRMVLKYSAFLGEAYSELSLIFWSFFQNPKKSDVTDFTGEDHIKLLIYHMLNILMGNFHFNGTTVH